MLAVGIVNAVASFAVYVARWIEDFFGRAVHLHVNPICIDIEGCEI